MASQSPKGQSPKTAREKAAQARAAAEAADKRRRTIINVAIGVVLLVVVAALIGGAYFTRQNQQEETQPTADAAMPTGAVPVSSPYKGGIPVAGEAAGKPVLEIWEDFQCPGCQSFEQTFGQTVVEIADAEDATVIWRMASFLDKQFPGQHSQRAANAWGCAIDGGKAVEYHDLVFANHPATEGDGWTDEQLLAFGSDAGLSGEALSTFEQCVADRTYFGWAANGTAWMSEAGVPSTPGLYLNGEKLPDTALASPDALRQAVQAAGGASPAPSQ